MAPEIRLTAEWVAAAVAGTIVRGSPRQVFAGVSIDTRTLGPGELYVAIRGGPDKFCYTSTDYSACNARRDKPCSSPTTTRVPASCSSPIRRNSFT